VSAIESAQQYDRVWGLVPSVTFNDCDATAAIHTIEHASIIRPGNETWIYDVQ
jgi:hypothetical protein